MHISMTRSWMMDSSSNDCLFARDIVIYIMETFYIGYDWRPPNELTACPSANYTSYRPPNEPTGDPPTGCRPPNEPHVPPLICRPHNAPTADPPTGCRPSNEPHVPPLICRAHNATTADPQTSWRRPAPLSPFTPEIRNAVTQIFLDNRLEMHKSFEKQVYSYPVTNMKYSNICIRMVGHHETFHNPLEATSFLELCIRMTCYAARSFLFGARNAPKLAVCFICQVLFKLRQRGFFTRDSWRELHIACKLQYDKPAK